MLTRCKNTFPQLANWYASATTTCGVWAGFPPPFYSIKTRYYTARVSRCRTQSTNICHWNV